MKLNRSLVLLFTALLLAGCASSGNSANEATTDKPTNGAEQTTVAQGKQTNAQDYDFNPITGVITEVDHTDTGHWILVEADPTADCRNGPVKPECGKMYYNIRDQTDVLREAGSNRKVAASPSNLQTGQLVRAWRTGPYATSYPGQARARTVVILEPT